MIFLSLLAGQGEREMGDETILCDIELMMEQRKGGSEGVMSCSNNCNNMM